MDIDVQAYEFMLGLLSDMDFNAETLYNNFQGSGNIIWAPVQSELSEAVHGSEPSTEFPNYWNVIHESGHALQEGVHSLFAKSAIPSGTDEECHRLAQCLLNVTPDTISDEMKNVLDHAGSDYLNHPKEMGNTVLQLAKLACSLQPHI